MLRQLIFICLLLKRGNKNKINCLNSSKKLRKENRYMQIFDYSIDTNFLDYLTQYSDSEGLN